MNDITSDAVISKTKNFFLFFLEFLKSGLTFEHFQTKMTVIDFLFPKLRTPKTWLDKRLKSPVSDDRSRSNMVNVSKHCWNLHHITFIVFIYHWQENWVGKSPCYWHAKPWDCWLTHCLPMRSILFLKETI